MIVRPKKLSGHSPFLEIVMHQNFLLLFPCHSLSCFFIFCSLLYYYSTCVLWVPPHVLQSTSLGSTTKRENRNPILQLIGSCSLTNVSQFPAGNWNPLLHYYHLPHSSGVVLGGWCKHLTQLQEHLLSHAEVLEPLEVIPDLQDDLFPPCCSNCLSQKH